jgi:hypothetical protein
MKKINIIASTEAFENLATFESIEQLNEAVRYYKRELNKTELAVLDQLHRYSAKYKGVSFLCKNKIAELIGKSRRTVIRVCHRLEALGIIRQVPMKRASDMQQTSNAIVIQPVTSNQIAEVPKMEQRAFSLSPNGEPLSANVTQEPSENVTPVRQNPSLKQEPYLHNTYPVSAYVKFKRFVGQFVSDSKLTSKLYGIYLAQTHYLRLSEQYDPSELFNSGLLAIKAAFQTTKRKNLRSITGYYSGVLGRLLDRLYSEVVDNLV